MVYLALLRGINVGGNNKVPMAELRNSLEASGYTNVTTYINSGNVILSSDATTDAIVKSIESTIATNFTVDTAPIKVLVLSREQLANIVANAPEGFGENPSKYHSDVAFLIGKKSSEAMEQFEPHPEVDTVWAGDRVVYYRRLSAKLTKSRISKIINKPMYKSMTIRTWNTVRKLNDLMQNI